MAEDLRPFEIGAGGLTMTVVPDPTMSPSDGWRIERACKNRKGDFICTEPPNHGGRHHDRRHKVWWEEGEWQR